MKKNTFVIIAILGGMFCGQAQENILWDYPVKPGTEEWATLVTKRQMVDTCQIPLDILNNLSTIDLISTCLNYPMFNDYAAYDDERRGMYVMVKSFNGLQELSQREDRITELIQTYSNFSILTQIQKDPASPKYHLPYQLPFLELLLCDPLFLNAMDNDELEELRIIALNKYENKLQNQNVYSLAFNTTKTMLLIVSILDRQNNETLTLEQQETIKMFIKTYNHCSSSLLTEVSQIISL